MGTGAESTVGSMAFVSPMRYAIADVSTPKFRDGIRSETCPEENGEVFDFQRNVEQSSLGRARE